MPPPIFIIGHWRSGTTHLYNILSKGDFGYVSPFAAGMPLEYQTLGRWLRPLLARMLPETRFVDRVAVRPDSPQEDEIPLGSIAPISFYHGVYFPRHFERHLNRSLFLDDCTPAEIAAWETAFRRFTEKLWLDQGKRPLIKNPTYSARIPQLRRLFPDARFIHIYRHPEAVFRSTRRFYQTLIDRFAWQDGHRLDLDRLVLQSYRRMMDRIEIDKRNLPESHFVDLRFEDLESRPLEEIERLYRQLDLDDISRWRAVFERYLASVEGFEKSLIPETPDERMMIERHCRNLLDRLGYAALGS
ncbi:MAG: sulfotransferase family protein [Geminicoccaceae bacterium]